MSEHIRKLVERLFRDASLSPEIVESMIALVEEEVSRERRRCVEECRRRAELWRNTTLSQSEIPAAREEARARANEAQVLADLLDG